jgi:hypothetical protein
VLIIGSGASGAQIAEELFRAGRRVYLSVGRHRRMPRRYRGRDLIWWLATLGLDQTPVERRGPDRSLPLITGAYGGHTIDFRQFAAQGMTLLGRVKAARAGTLEFAPDLADNLAFGDAAYTAFLDVADAHVTRHGLDMPEEPGRPPGPSGSTMSRATGPPPRPSGPRHIRGHLGNRLWLRFQLDRFAGAGRERRADSSRRHYRHTGPVFHRSCNGCPR